MKSIKSLALLGLVSSVGALALFTGCSSNNSPTQPSAPTATPAAPTNTPAISNTPTATPSNTSSGTPTSTATNSPTGTPSSTPSNTATNTLSFTPTNSATPSPSNTPSDTATNSPTPSATSTPTLTATLTPTSTPTDSPTITYTPTITWTPTITYTPTVTPTAVYPFVGYIGGVYAYFDVVVTGSSSITLAASSYVDPSHMIVFTGTDASLSAGTADPILYGNPNGMAFDPSGSNLFVFETYIGTPYVEKRPGPFSATGTAWVPVTQAVGLAVDASDNVYLTDPNTNKVWKYNSAGVSLASWGGYNTPSEAVVDNTNTYLYVANYGDGTIIRTGLNGSGQTVFATLPNVYSQTPQAYGVAVDSSGNVFATDGAHDFFYKYDSSGNLLASIDASAQAPGQYVHGIAVDANGYVFVATSGQILEYAPH